MENQDDLGKILTVEQGKPLAEAIGEIGYAASFFKYYSEAGVDLLRGETLQSATVKNPVMIVAEKEPVGIVGAITPWNFPSAMITRKAAAALVAGCTFVVKPSELTPYSALAIAYLAREAGVPTGVFNIVCGDAPAIGKEMAANPLVRKITFTGSTRVGKLLLEQAAQTVKRISMELGGNAPFIVFNDADIEHAVKQALTSKTRNAGQTCVTPNRFLVQAGVHDEFVKRMVETYGALKVGVGLEEGVQMGPLINKEAVRKVEAQLEDAVKLGAKVMCGGHRLTIGDVSEEETCFFEPTVIANATPDMKVFSEETFGPLLPIFKFHTTEEAVKMANNTRAGLASYFFTESQSTQQVVARALQYGMVACNHGSVSSCVAPFGGVKESGIGREGSKYGIDEYVSVKAVHYHLKHLTHL
jgi:succinate-semialdehyde dehydrogenase/glutarate-semialdehyde dehydrogenase